MVELEVPRVQEEPEPPREASGFGQRLVWLEAPLGAAVHAV